ncbi:CPC_1213 family protein [Faecalispora anaeroviscerum]|uniref:CPC_1213 family protein n=1 Tax=Faecalispora anaeroviscerum TaxID=2991836 RepID=UPI0024B92C4E|nr:CPC_1213 family protein [Faecalispora anaeroviscerum]
MSNQKKSSKNGKNQEKKFPSKHVKHDPNAESARAVFGLKEAEQTDNRHLSI